MRKETGFAAIVLFGLLLQPSVVFSATLSGEIGASPQWGSGWIDLANVRTFQKDEKLRLKVGGTAKKIVVRLLPRGSDPNQPHVMVGGVLEVPENRVVELALETGVADVVQISVHGFAKPFDLYDLGESNGPATLLAAEIVDPQKGIKTGVSAYHRLNGEIGASARWGSGWLNLSAARQFHRGDRLRLKLGGTAKKIVIRLLPQGADPNEPQVIVGDVTVVPDNRIVELILDTDVADVVQISVHGKSNPWGLYDLGAANGPATLLTCEEAKTPR